MRVKLDVAMVDWEMLDVGQVGCCHGGLGDIRWGQVGCCHDGLGNIRCGSSRMLPWWIGRY